MKIRAPVTPVLRNIHTKFGLSKPVFELGAGMGHTDGRTDKQTHERAKPAVRPGRPHKKENTYTKSTMTNSGIKYKQVTTSASTKTLVIDNY